MDKIKTFIIISVVALIGVAAFIIIRGLSPDGPATEMVVNEVNGSMTSEGQENVSQDGVAVNIEISNFAYTPARRTVKKGTTVTWTNRDRMEHDIAPDNPTASFAKSPLLGRGESYSVTFDEVGTYTYYCSPHPYMTGEIEVVE